MSQDDLDGLFKGLSALAATAFPKQCNTCGRRFETPDQFVRETQRVRPEITGLTSYEEDDGSHVIELFRNCPCGSTLMDAFNDRRDITEQGDKRRKQFGKVLDSLEQDHGIEKDEARQELLKAMKGELSELIEKVRNTKK